VLIVTRPARCLLLVRHELEMEESVLNQMLSMTDAAELLGTSRHFVRRLVAERRIRFYKVGRHVRIAEADLLSFVAAGRVEATGRRG
jgi:excisionase family DNA binding protein